jgi:hypothetical protein
MPTSWAPTIPTRLSRPPSRRIDEETWATLSSDTSRPFDKPGSGRIAVKVINHLGDEVMKVFGWGEGPWSYALRPAGLGQNAPTLSVGEASTTRFVSIMAESLIALCRRDKGKTNG